MGLSGLYRSRVHFHPDEGAISLNMGLLKRFGRILRFMTNREVRIAKTRTSVIYLVTDKLTVECNIVFYDYEIPILL